MPRQGRLLTCNRGGGRPRLGESFRATARASAPWWLVTPLPQPGLTPASRSSAKSLWASLLALRPDTRIFKSVRQEPRLNLFTSLKFITSTSASRTSVDSPKLRMNLKSSAKKPGFSLRSTGTRSFACQYKHFLNALFAYFSGGQRNRWQKSTWNCCIATTAEYHLCQVPSVLAKSRRELDLGKNRFYHHRLKRRGQSDAQESVATPKPALSTMRFVGGFHPRKLEELPGLLERVRNRNELRRQQVRLPGCLGERKGVEGGFVHRAGSCSCSLAERVTPPNLAFISLAISRQVPLQ